MNLVEMIQWIADRDHLHDGPKITAALRAGERMRSCYILPGHRQCPEGMIAAVDYKWACEAWDAATKEEDV